MVFKCLKQEDLVEEKFIGQSLYEMMQLKKKINVKDEFDIFKESTTPKNPEKRKKSTNF